MTKFIAKRLLAGLILLAAVCMGTFFLAHLAISDPTVALLGSSATPEQQAVLAKELGLDRPLLVQFQAWLSSAITGDLGTSWRNQQPVWDQIVLRVPVTLSVVSFAILISAFVGVVCGLIAGLNPGSTFDKGVKIATVLLFALPGFWISLMLVIWFAVRLRWFPSFGYVSPAVSFGGWIRSITLPAVALALGAIVMIAEQLRNQVIAVSQQDFVRTLRSRGLSNFRVNLHILRNASPAALTVIAVLFASLLSGAIVVEAIFSLPGLGQLTQSAAQIGDIPVLLGITMVSVVFVVIIYVVLDIALGWINPKVRLK
ncbi:peptide/nickel transport system permease protein [Maritalea mobilis]|uniref:Peptide/nickel transport system permease protein n=1 Tax=Maritalea mobilis TaxID=483324 RepID=A0A4R6VQX6_9HYPH|nr:ABC transporter permease [Maritalea mobilis]TDQ62037.1 peptide/nickel transport system permease protein [Maritalea mobilis]